MFRTMIHIQIVTLAMSTTLRGTPMEVRDTDGITSAGNTSQTARSYLPVENGTVPYWRSELHPLDEHRSTADLPKECDIAIIGTGLSGVSTAYHILDRHDSKKNGPAPSVCLLEARQVCSGATGRNGGFLQNFASVTLRNIATFGQEAADELYTFINNQMYAMKEVAEKEQLDCEYQLRRGFDVYYNASLAGIVKEAIEQQRQDGKPWTKDVDIVPELRLDRITALRHRPAGANTMPAASFWPYKFVSQLLAVVLKKGVDNGVNLQTRTAVHRVSKLPDGKTSLQTSRGTLVAKKVVFATNGYTTSVLPQYEGCIVPHKGMNSHQKVGALGGVAGYVPYLAYTYNIVLPSGSLDYMNPRPDGGVIVGGGLEVDSVDDSTIYQSEVSHFERYMQKNFVGWENSQANYDFLWSGIMGYTPDGMPYVGQIPGEDNWFILAGFNGAGMPLIYLSGLGVAKMVNEGKSFEESGVPRVFKVTQERLQACSNKG